MEWIDTRIVQDWEVVNETFESMFEEEIYDDNGKEVKKYVVTINEMGSNQPCVFVGTYYTTAKGRAARDRKSGRLKFEQVILERPLLDPINKLLTDDVKHYCDSYFDENGKMNH